MPDNKTEQLLYPAGLLRWAGHREGGVRKPFRRESGRPAGMHVTTPLIQRLHKWTKDFVDGAADCPVNIVLVGGPGNGKTDAMEICVELLDKYLGADGDICAAFANEFAAGGNDFPPRKVEVDYSSLLPQLGSNSPRTITLVQDATEGGANTTESAEKLLLDDLEKQLEAPEGGIYLCCVNRGILAQAASLAHEAGYSGQVLDLLDAITAAVTCGPNSPQCWPLADFPRFAVWPMDVESLVDQSQSPDGLTVAHQIFSAALQPDMWIKACEAGKHCPFCQNRVLLAEDGAIDALVRLLRFYELGSGKRWTFRDLFSLVPFLLVGDAADLEVGGRQLSPCEWAAHQLRLSSQGSSRDAANARAPYLLVSRLYYHRLFPVWPSLNRGEHHTAKSLLRSSFTAGLNTAREFFNLLVSYSSAAATNSSEIALRIRESFGAFLDPALAPVESGMIDQAGQLLTVGELEERFSMSVRSGLELVSEHIQPLERELMIRLADADDALAEEHFPRAKSHDAKLLQASLRQFCCRLIKRSLGVRRGICRDLTFYEEYENALNDENALFTVRRQLKQLLHDAQNRFSASLVTTFGQPLAKRARDITLLAQGVQVRNSPGAGLAGRPAEPIPYLWVDRHLVPLTFTLFKSLREVVDGLHDASLPSEIFAQLNSIRSLVAGTISRDLESLSEDSSIRFGCLPHEVVLREGKYTLVPSNIP